MCGENTSCLGENDVSTYSATKNLRFNKGSITTDQYDKLDYEIEDHQPLFDEDCFNPLNC